MADKNYNFYYKEDEDKYKHFEFILDELMDHKLSHCAPVHEEHWADVLINRIGWCFTGKQIKHIAEELTAYAERMGL